MATRIITDSTATLPAALRAELGIAVVSLTITFGSSSMREDELDLEELYAHVRAGDPVASSQPAQSEFERVFERAVATGDDVLGVFISADMSGTYSTACQARTSVLARFPDAVIELLDSRSSAMQQGIVALAAARAALAPRATLARVAEVARFAVEHSRILFVPATLDYLARGGRIGGAAALIGQVLRVRPLLTVTDGKAAVAKRVRTQARAVRTMLETLADDVSRRGLGEVFVQHILADQPAAELAAAVQRLVGRLPLVCPISPVIGLHVGPGALGLAYSTER
jgi:DegV family protein with EDD domain